MNIIYISRVHLGTAMQEHCETKEILYNNILNNERHLNRHINMHRKSRSNLIDSGFRDHSNIFKSRA